MALDDACFSMENYPPGVVVLPALFNQDLPVCYPLTDAIRICLSMVVGITANVGALILIWFSRKQEHVPTSYNIPNVLVLVLCAIDLTRVLFGDSVWIITILYGSWLGGSGSLLYSNFISTMCLRLSGFVVIFMGVERYLSLLKPFFYDNSVTLQRIFIAIFILVIYSFAMASFQIVGQVNVMSHPCNLSTTSFCFTHGNSTVYWTSVVYTVYDIVTVIESLANIAILVFCNVFVIRCMRQMRQRIDLVCPRNRDEYIKQVDMIRGVSAEFSRLMVGITLVFVITVIPYEVCVLCNHFQVWYSPTLDYISSLLYMSTTTINPLMYGLFRRKYRRKVWRKVVKLLSTCRHGNRVHPHEDAVGKDEIRPVEGEGTGRSSES